jgi:hypothetical protein
MLAQFSPGGREPDLAVAAVEQFDPQFLLQRRHMLADGRLCDAQRPRRRREALAVVNGDYGVQMFQFHTPFIANQRWLPTTRRDQLT